jgi:glutamyl-tRNA reductase
VAESLFTPIAIAGLSHHNADVAQLEAFRLPYEEEFLRQARERFKGAVLLQTCNRVEVLVQGDSRVLEEFLREIGKKEFTVWEGTEALRHLLELASGIDSMIVGEDQILGQLKTALIRSQETGTCSNVLEICIIKAVHVGIEVRRRTEINRGAVSVGSAAVILAEQELGTLEGKHILVIGSGEMGMLVTQALAAKHLTAIYVANRTFDRAVILANKIGGRAVRFTELERYIALSDVVISCTSAPHPVIHKKDLVAAMKARCWPLEGHPRQLILIDIAQPRDVEPGAGTIDGVRLFTIDDLRGVNDQAMQNRRQEAERAREYLSEELDQFIRQLNRKAADDILAVLHTWAEAIRIRERDRAVARLGTRNERMAGVLDDLTRVLVNKVLADATLSIRACAEKGDLAAAESLVRAITQGERLCFQHEE